MTTITSVLYLPCPKCGVGNGEACRRPDGLHALAPHVSRRRAVDALQNCRSTSSDSSVTRSEVSTNLNASDPSRTLADDVRDGLHDQPHP